MNISQLAAQISAQALALNKLQTDPSAVAILSASAAVACSVLAVYAKRRGWHVRRAIFSYLAFCAVFATGVYLT